MEFLTQGSPLTLSFILCAGHSILIECGHALNEKSAKLKSFVSILVFFSFKVVSDTESHTSVDGFSVPGLPHLIESAERRQAYELEIRALALVLVSRQEPTTHTHTFPSVKSVVTTRF